MKSKKTNKQPVSWAFYLNPPKENTSVFLSSKETYTILDTSISIDFLATNNNFLSPSSYTNTVNNGTLQVSSPLYFSLFS